MTHSESHLPYPFKGGPPAFASPAPLRKRADQICEKGDPWAAEKALVTSEKDVGESGIISPPSSSPFNRYLAYHFPNPDPRFIRAVLELGDPVAVEVARNKHLDLEGLTVVQEFALQQRGGRHRRTAWKLTIALSRHGVRPGEELLDHVLERPSPTAVERALPIATLPAERLEGLVEAARRDLVLLEGIAHHPSANGDVWCAVLDETDHLTLWEAFAEIDGALQEPRVREKLKAGSRNVRQLRSVFIALLQTAGGEEVRDLFFDLAAQNAVLALATLEQMDDEQIKAIRPDDLMSYLKSSNALVRQRALLLTARVGGEVEPAQVGPVLS